MTAAGAVTDRPASGPPEGADGRRAVAVRLAVLAFGPMMLLQLAFALASWASEVSRSIPGPGPLGRGDAFVEARRVVLHALGRAFASREMVLMSGRLILIAAGLFVMAAVLRRPAAARWLAGGDA